MLRRPLELKSTGNQSIGIDLTSKKDFMKKYLFFFENELIEVLVIAPKSRYLRAKTGLIKEINCYITVYFFDQTGYLKNGFLVGALRDGV